MHKYEEYTGDDARKQVAMPVPFGLGIDDARIERIEVWATGFNDPGPDYCEFRCFDKAGKLFATHRINGY